MGLASAATRRDDELDDAPAAFGGGRSLLMFELGGGVLDEGTGEAAAEKECSDVAAEGGQLVNADAVECPSGPELAVLVGLPWSIHGDRRMWLIITDSGARMHNVLDEPPSPGTTFMWAHNPSSLEARALKAHARGGV